MTTAALWLPADRDSTIGRIVLVGWLVALVDGAWAVVLTLLYGRSLERSWQGIAATVLGERALIAGTRTVIMGLGMHLLVAILWSSVLLVLFEESAWLRRRLATRGGMLAVAAVWGPFIWIVMSCFVVPMLTRRPVSITWRWWVQAAGHVVFVALPMAWGAVNVPGRTPVAR